MNIDDLRSQWQNIGSGQADVPSDVREMLARAERRTALKDARSLRDNYFRLCMRMIAVSGLGVLAVVPFAKESAVLFACSVTFFVLMALSQLWQAMEVRRLDFGHMSVREAVEGVCRLERIRVIKRTVGITLAVPLLAYMGAVQIHLYGSGIAVGLAAGAVIGMAVGLMVNHRASSLLREMKERVEGSEES